MSYNGSGTFQINTSGQPVVTGTSISSTVFNALTADLATGLSTAITKDGQTTTTARIPFALGINSTLVTDATNTTSGSIITAGGVGIAKALYVGTTANVAGAVTLGGVATFSAQPIFSSLTASSAVATDASKGLVSVTNTGTGNNVLATTPTIATPSISSPTISDGTANGVAYLNGSKVLTTGSALVFDGTNLGVGVTPSAWGGALSAGMDFKFSGGIASHNSANAFYLVANGYYNSSGVWKYRQNGYANYVNVGNGDGSIAFYNAASGTAGNSISFTQAMTLDANGALLVGTTTASYTSSGRGNITVGGSSGALYALQTGGTAKGYLYHDGTDLYLNSAASGRITITPQSSGVYLANGATSWTSNSDERKKDIIEPILNAVIKVSTLRAVIGKYKTDNDGRRRSFLIAQDVQAVLPEAVDASNPDDLGVQYTEVIPLLVAAIKEQSALITQLQADVAALKGASA